MRIFHLNCGTISARLTPAEAIIYCLLVETNQGLLLVDTGIGLEDYSQPTRIMNVFMWLMGMPRDPGETAARQILKLGYAIEDVRHIVLTHMHLDHAGGLRDFPKASVHIFKDEYEAAMKPRGLIERAYLPIHWSHGPEWVFHESPRQRWFGFDALPILEGLVPEVLLVPLVGHTRGHCGVAVQMDGGWLFHVGDAASPFNKEVDLHQLPASCQRLNYLPKWIVYRVIGPHVPRLRQLKQEHGSEISFISAHDIYSFRKFTGDGEPTA
jgi:glyoxylase-like metal-dependent hydrolase (beta-lactamase superfamily II)